MKRYWRAKYERIVDNCGPAEAGTKFKNLRVQVLSYIADADRKSNLDKYLRQAGFRCNGYLRMLFEYADTQPHFVLSFLKIFSMELKSSQSMDQAAGNTKARLEAVRANASTPKYLMGWLNNLITPHGVSYRRARRDQYDPFHKLALNHSYEEWHEYWLKWYCILRNGWKSSSSLDYKPVFPEIYKDYADPDRFSRSYRADFADLVSMHFTEDPALSAGQLGFVDESLNDEVGDALYAVLWGETQGFEDLFQETSILSGLTVGHVHHIHKKGGGTDLRDIAVPNRFIQNALVPAADRMYNLVRKLPKDATFDQDRFDALIQNRVNNDNLYQGSVDLSKATDNLPFHWGDVIISFLERELRDPDPEADTEFSRSYDLFRTVARARWEDEGYLITWKVGQPLGSLPSFAILAITHNLLVESLAASLGYRHSPYFVLGDDIVITNKKLRLRYIRDLRSRGIPLSLHKSFEGRLSEFAGKTYVKNCVPFYCSDHNPVTWESLFDWQRTTGIRIPWDNLPKAIKGKVYHLVRSEICEKDPSCRQVMKLARASYDLVLSCEITGRGSHIYQLSDSALLSELISGYFERRYNLDNPIPDAVKHTGITLIGSGHPVVLMNTRFADKDGYFLRYRPVKLPDWYKTKVRPCATSSAIRAAIGACSEMIP
jgi:hypothetical protein